MALRYKIDVLAALKAAGYNTNRIRKEHIIAEGTLQRLREQKIVSIDIIDKICEILDVQPGDIIEHIRDTTHPDV